MGIVAPKRSHTASTIRTKLSGHEAQGPCVSALVTQENHPPAIQTEPTMHIICAYVNAVLRRDFRIDHLRINRVEGTPRQAWRFRFLAISISIGIIDVHSLLWSHQAQRPHTAGEVPARLGRAHWQSGRGPRSAGRTRAIAGSRRRSRT